MPSYRLIDLEGIGPANSRKMDEARIKTVRGLLQKGGTPKGRKELAERTGISESVILRWVNMADLFRINGIGTQYAELLEKAGVDTVKELRTRNATNLVASMQKANEAGGRRLVRLVPGLKRAQTWISEAKKLKPAVTY
jgi:predicted flap endonuclease-1-like 5' DNA nuclease